MRKRVEEALLNATLRGSTFNTGDTVITIAHTRNECLQVEHNGEGEGWG